MILDAGSVIPDLIRDRHDEQKFDALLNFDTASQWRGSLRMGNCLDPNCTAVLIVRREIVQDFLQR